MKHRTWSNVIVLLLVAISMTISTYLLPGSAAKAETTPSSLFAIAQVTKTSDGTGHGTAAQTFVNSTNHFTPGDNTPTDGVVSSGDTVSYNVRLDFTAARSRQVWVGFELDTEAQRYVKALNSQSCQAGSTITAVSHNGGCLYSIPSGATGSFNQTLMLVALDTQGVAISGIRPKVTLVRYENGAAVAPADKLSYTADPVTVVSAPAADVIVRNFDNTTSNGKAERRAEYKPNDTNHPAITGYFDLTVAALHYPGYSTHGASTSGQWSATVDVSNFPTNTTWKLVRDKSAGSSTEAGTPVDLTASQGKLTLSGLSGDKTATLTWSIPYNTIADRMSADTQTSTLNFDIQVIPDTTSFESTSGGRVLKNMGTGTEPGRSQGKDETTEDTNTGAQAGYPYRNNDWSRAIIDKKEVKGDIYYKQLRVPNAEGKTKFDAESKVFASAEPDAPSWVVDVARRTDQVASGTQVRTTLGAIMSAIPAQGLATTTTASKPHYIGDTWKADEQEYVGNLRVQQGNTVLAPGTDYVLEYTTTPYAPGDVPADGQMPEPTNWTWTAGDPSAAPPGTVTGVRARILDSTISKLTTGTNAAELTMTFDVKVHKDASQGNQKLIDTGIFALRPASNVQGLGFAVYQGSVTVVPPITPSAVIRNTLTVSAADTGTQRGQISHISTDSRTPEPITGGIPADQVNITLQPSAWQSYSGIAMTPVVSLAYPKGLIKLTVDDGPWQMTEVGSGDNRTLEFRLKNDNGVITPEVTRDGYIKLPDVVLRGTVANNFGGTVPVSAQLTYTTQPKDDIAAVTVQSGRADTSLVMNNAQRGSGIVSAEPRTEINDPLHFEFNVEGRGPNRTGTLTTVLHLPTNQDQNLLYNNGKGLDGSWNDYERGYSHYSGTYQMAEEVHIDSENSSRNQVWYSTTPLRGIPLASRDDPNKYAWKTWQKLTDADKGRITAIKVVSDFLDLQGDNTDGQPGKYAAAHGTITLQPSGNKEGDQYNIWLGRNYYTDGSKDPLPWADKEVVVSSTISGTVWWDQNDNASIDTDTEHPENNEERIAGVTVSLYRADQVNAEGTVSGRPLQTTLTNSDGFYQFTGLHSGQYVTVVKRANGTVTGGTNKGVQTEVHSYYNEVLKVKNTVSYASQIGDAARDFSQVIQLGVDDDVQHVDFGYLRPDPKVTLDKTHVSTECDDTTCEVKWDVSVQNKSGDGRSVLSTDTGAILNDRMSNEVTNVKVTAGTQSITPNTYHKIKDIARVRYRVPASNMNVRSVSVFIDDQGKPWVWGPNTDILENGEPGYCYSHDDYYSSTNLDIGFHGGTWTTVEGKSTKSSFDGAQCIKDADGTRVVTWQSAYRYFYGGRNIDQVKAEWDAAQLDEQLGAVALPLLPDWDAWKTSNNVKTFEKIFSDGENRFVAIDDKGRAWTWGDRPILTTRVTGTGSNATPFEAIDYSEYNDMRLLAVLEASPDGTIEGLSDEQREEIATKVYSPRNPWLTTNVIRAWPRSDTPMLITGLSNNEKVTDVLMDRNEITVRTDRGAVYALGERIVGNSNRDYTTYSQPYCLVDRHMGYNPTANSTFPFHNTSGQDMTSSANQAKQRFMRVSFTCNTLGLHNGSSEPSIVGIFSSSSMNQVGNSNRNQFTPSNSVLPTFAVDSNGKVYRWHVSSNLVRSQYYAYSTAYRAPQQYSITLPRNNERITKIVPFADTYVIALTQSGKLYAWSYADKCDWLIRNNQNGEIIKGTGLIPNDNGTSCSITSPVEVGTSAFADGMAHTISDITIYGHQLYAIDSAGAVLGLQRSSSREGAQLNTKDSKSPLAINSDNSEASCAVPSDAWITRIQVESLGDGKDHSSERGYFKQPTCINMDERSSTTSSINYQYPFVNTFQTILPAPSTGRYRLAGNVSGPGYTTPYDPYGYTPRRSPLPAVINTETGEAYTWDVGLLADQMNIGNAWKPWNEQTPTLITSPQLIKAVKQAGNTVDPTAVPVSAVSEQKATGATTRTYKLPNQLLPKPTNPAEGDRVVFHMTGTVNKPAASAGTLKIGNQAWFSADRTPYYSTQPAADGNAAVQPVLGNAVGVPHARSALNVQTGTAVQPLLFSLTDTTMKTLHTNGGDVTGNASCAVGSTYRTSTNTLEDAETLEHRFDNSNEDSCDQAWTLVAALPAGEQPILGSVSGYYWYDDGTPTKNAQYRLWPRKLPTPEHAETPAEGKNANAPRFPGQVVNLLNKDGEIVATTVTNSDNYYKFTDLPLGEYSVQFSRVPHRDFIAQPDFFCKDKSGAELTACVNNDVTTNGDNAAPWDSDASINEDTYGLATPKIVLTRTKPDWVHIDAGVSDPKVVPATQLPLTGLGRTLPLLLVLGLVGLIAAIILLRDKREK